jgi:hypothetical protein
MMSYPLKLLVLAFATVLMAAAAISNQSLWIDEGGAAIKAIQPTIAGWWEALRTENNSNLQLIVHLLYLWSWAKLFGGSEVALRAANVPLLFGALAAAMWGLRGMPGRQCWFVLLALVNAFTWYYVGEARPYILLLAASCAALAALYRAYTDPAEATAGSSWFRIFSASLLLVCATSLVAVPWALSWALAAAILVGFGNLATLARSNLRWTIGCAVTVVALAAYYLWTISIGARATDVGRTGLLNALYIVYEQLGLAGLGPGRNEVRTLGVRTALPHLVPLVLGCLALLMPAWSGVRALAAASRDKQLLHLLLCALVLPVILVLVAGSLMDVRIVGRHFTPAYPLVLFGLAVGVERLLAKKAAVGRIAVATLLAMLLASSLEIRFAPRHARDDYRGAAQFALKALQENRLVWWAADVNTGMYYGVPFANEGSDAAIKTYKKSAHDLSALPVPDMIIASKADIHDPEGTLRAFISEHDFVVTGEPHAFRIFERPPRANGG